MQILPTSTGTALHLLALTSLLTLTNPAMAEEPSLEGRKVGETIYATIDASGRGVVHMGDIEQFRALVYAGMDGDGNLQVSYEEFSSWDPGFAYVAEQEGRVEPYKTASKIVFAFWDRDGDGALTEPEMRFAMAADFRRADRDDDALLTEDEFLLGFPIMVAMRAALRPDL